jgi:hypothetical protein
MVKNKEFERRQRKCTGFWVFQIKFILSFGYQKTVSIGRVTGTTGLYISNVAIF